MQILPPEDRIAVRARPARTSESSLARADAAAFVIAERDPSAALAALPHASLWQALYRGARRASKTPLLVARLPNSRHTLAAVAFLRAGASAYERLELAGKLMRELLKPGVASLQCHATGFDGEETAAVVEALVSAALAAAAPLPQRKSKPAPECDLRSIDAHGRRRQPPRALAHCPAAERTRLRELPAHAPGSRA